MNVRGMCTHQSKTGVNIYITWCVRCSGWHYLRAGWEQGSLLDGYTNEPSMERHFLPAEETTPDDLLALTSRAFRAAQEWEQDKRNT